MTEKLVEEQKAFRVSIVVEEWRHTGDERSPCGWETADTIRLCLCSGEEALAVCRKIQEQDLP